MLKARKDLMKRYSIRPRPELYTSVSPDLSRLAGMEVQVSFSWLKRCWCYYHGNKGAVAGGHRKIGVQGYSHLGEPISGPLAIMALVL